MHTYFWFRYTTNFHEHILKCNSAVTEINYLKICVLIFFVWSEWCLFLSKTIETENKEKAECDTRSSGTDMIVDLF